MNYLKPTREIVNQLNSWSCKSLEILVHGIGKIQNLVYHKEYFTLNDNYEEIWKFNMQLNNGIAIKCQTVLRLKESKSFFYFEEGDEIEFFGKVYTNWMGGRFSEKDVSSIYIYQAKLSEEKNRYFTEVFMWNIRKHEYYNKFSNRYVVTTQTQYCIESEIACVGEIEPQENTWAYGQLVKRGNLVILELIKMMV